MQIKPKLSTPEAPQPSFPKAKVSDLPDVLLAATFSQLDEPSRMKAALACKHFATVMPQARRGQPLPTRQQLAKAGTWSPDGQKILDAFRPSAGGAQPGPEKLRAHYTQLAALQAPMAKKLVGKVEMKNGGLYVGHTVEGKPDGFGLHSYHMFFYEGEFKGGLPEGWGFTRESGYTYEGDFKSAQRHGQGVQDWVYGMRYEGEHQAGKRHGFGILTLPDGSRSEGTWKNGKQHGHFIETKEGFRREGGYREDKPHGQVTFDQPDGRRYEGEYIDGKLRGQGVVTWADGRRYEGAYVGGEPNGQGVMTWADGRRYEGMFEQGKPHGEGVTTSSDGSRYAGEHRGGMQHGRGIRTAADGSRCHVRYENDRPVTSGPARNKDGPGPQQQAASEAGSTLSQLKAWVLGG